MARKPQVTESAAATVALAQEANDHAAAFQAFAAAIGRDPNQIAALIALGEETVAYTDGKAPARVGDLPHVTLARVFVKGWNEILRDSGAMSQKAIDEIRKTATDAGLDADKAVEDEKAKRFDARYNSLLSGEYETRTRAPKVSDFDKRVRAKAMLTVAKAWQSKIDKGVVKKGVKMTDEQIESYVTRAMELNGEKYRAEVEAELAAAAKDAETIDLD
jgi:hypothetical protein